MPTKCAKCDDIIGALETPENYKGHIVCATCYRKLMASQNSGGSSERISSQPQARPAPAQARPMPMQPQVTTPRQILPPHPLATAQAILTPQLVADSPPMVATRMGYQPLNYSLQNLRPLNLYGLLGLILVCISFPSICVPNLALVGLLGLGLAILGLVMARKQNSGVAVCWTAIGLSVIPLCGFVFSTIFLSRHKAPLYTSNDYQSTPGTAGQPRPTNTPPVASTGLIPPSLQSVMKKSDASKPFIATKDDLAVTILDWTVISQDNPDFPKLRTDVQRVLAIRLRFSAVYGSSITRDIKVSDTLVTLYYGNSTLAGMTDQRDPISHFPIDNNHRKDMTFYYPLPEDMNANMAVRISDPSMGTSDAIILQIPAGSSPSDHRLPGGSTAATPKPQKPSIDSMPSSLRSQIGPEDYIGMGSVSADGLLISLVSAKTFEKGDTSAQHSMMLNQALMRVTLRLSVPKNAKSPKAIKYPGKSSMLYLDGVANGSITEPGGNSIPTFLKPGESMEINYVFIKPVDVTDNMAVLIDQATLGTVHNAYILIPPGAIQPSQGPANGSTATTPDKPTGSHVPAILSRFIRSTDSQGVGSVTQKDLTLSLVSMSEFERGDTSLPQGLRGEGPVLAVTLRASASATAVKSISMPFPLSDANLYDDNSNHSNLFFQNRRISEVILAAGESQDFTFYFQSPSNLNVDLAIKVNGMSFGVSGQLYILIPAGYKPAAELSSTPATKTDPKALPSGALRTAPLETNGKTPADSSKLDIQGEGSVVVNDATISYVSMKMLPRSTAPRGLTGSGNVLAISLKVTVSDDAADSVNIRNPRDKAQLKIKGLANDAMYITSDPRGATLYPGATMDLTLYFPLPAARNVDMSIQLPGAMFGKEGTIEILLPKGSNYRPKRSSATTQPASTQPAEDPAN